jgi:hypothetical protein
VALPTLAHGKPQSQLHFSASDLKFQFVSQDGQISVPCTHKFDPAPEDWQVQCGDHQFLAHLRIFLHKSQTAPKTSYEILYWVTDRNVPAREAGRYVGSTNWLRFNDENSLHSFELSQDVENVYSLEVTAVQSI